MNRKEARERAQALVAQMTMEEAASQLRYNAPAIERLGVPAYNWWNEALHGVARAGTATSFPQAIGLAACFDTEMMKRLGDVVSTEGRAKYNASSALGDRDIYKGLTFWSPNVNIFRDPRWGRGHETYGEDPFLTGELGCAYVRGIQGEGDGLKAAACAKHFAVHSGPEGIRHSFDAQVSKKDLHETYLPAFKQLVTKARVESVMGAYNRVGGQVCCAHPELMGEILRGEWGFEGHYLSDCWAIRNFHETHQVTKNALQSAALALSMGCDLNCGCTYLQLATACRKGLVSEQDIRRSAVRLFTTRYLLGIMGEESQYDSISYPVVECPEHLREAHEASLKSCVLLKNEGMLPLNLEKISTLGVIGPNANSRLSLIGNYHGTSSRYITVLEGIQDEVAGRARVLYAEGCHLYKDHMEGLSEVDDRLSEAITVARCSDAVVLVVGLDETMEGEQGDAGNQSASGDKRDLLLPESQRRMVDAVLSVGKPTVIVLMAGSAIDLQQAARQADAVLLSWYPGARGGKAVAQLLLGEESPSGKLPLTFYHNRQLDEMPDFTDYSMKGRTYRYVEQEPCYPFGFGLTYGDVVVTAAEARTGQDGIHVTVQVENFGKTDTQDVVQLYCQNEGSEHAPRNPRLCAFARLACPARERVQAELFVPRECLLVTDDQGRQVEEGRIVLYAGMGQPDPLTERLTGHPAVKIQC